VTEEAELYLIRNVSRVTFQVSSFRLDDAKEKGKNQRGVRILPLGDRGKRRGRFEMAPRQNNSMTTECLQNIRQLQWQLQWQLQLQWQWRWQAAAYSRQQTERSWQLFKVVKHGK